MRCGIAEKHSAVKRIFLDVLLKKWVTHYNNSLVQLFSSLKLDADEDDVKQTTLIYKNLMEAYCK